MPKIALDIECIRRTIHSLNFILSSLDLEYQVQKRQNLSKTRSTFGRFVSESG